MFQSNICNINCIIFLSLVCSNLGPVYRLQSDEALTALCVRRVKERVTYIMCKEKNCT